jgi:hypothetical protein
VFLNDPRTPQAPVLRLLNRAAMAYEAHDITLAQDMVRQAIQVLEDGVRKQYYGESDIAPIISSIQTHVPFAQHQVNS